MTVDAASALIGGALSYGGKGLAMKQALAEAVEHGDLIVVVDEVTSMLRPAPTARFRLL